MKNKILVWILNTFYKDQSVLKDIIIVGGKVTIKNLVAPGFTGSVLMSVKELSCENSKSFEESAKKFLKKDWRKSL